MPRKLAKPIVAAAVGDKGRLTLPEQVRTHLGVAEGDSVILELGDDGTVAMIPAALVPRRQIWFLHDEVQRRLAEAHEDMRAGRTTRVQSSSALRAHLARVRSRTSRR
jgi:AbrB family looped-hinge helix DNA binding protein